MNTQEIANQLISKLAQGDYFGIYDDLFHPTEVEHIEPKSPAEPFRYLKGVEAIKAKDMQMGEMIAEASLPEVGEAIVTNTAIALPYKITAQLKDGSSLVLDELIVYEVADGKIVSEQFFY